jgi:hypothetical protein
LLIAGRAFADNSKISPDLQTLLANPSNNINVILPYNTPRSDNREVFRVGWWAAR